MRTRGEGAARNVGLAVAALDSENELEAPAVSTREAVLGSTDLLEAVLILACDEDALRTAARAACVSRFWRQLYASTSRASFPSAWSTVSAQATPCGTLGGFGVATLHWA
jgi:hypothetical protein